MKKSFFFLAFILVLSSCKKDATQTKTDILTSGPWKITGYTETYTTPDGQTYTEDGFAFFEDCEKARTQKYIANGTGITNNVIKCDPTDPDTDVFSWVFGSNETKISITQDGATYDYEIEELTTSKMVLTETNSVDSEPVVSKAFFSK